MRLSFLCLCFIATIFVRAQSIVSGKVINAEGEPLAHATVTAESPADSSVLAFAMTDAAGIYKLSLSTTLPRLLLRVRLLNYAPQLVLVDNKTQEQNFKTHAEAVMLKEVIVRPPLIIRNGDIVSYNADSFAAKQDRTLADVLKKLPGVDVSESGQISVQGQPINKFYVEGKDLMSGRYGVVTNSLPNKDVSRIEVLNNHQPIKMLQGKVPSIQPAMNIRLKKAVTFTGRAALGTGLTPFLWTASATPMWFTKKQQALITYKTNNTGDNVTGEMGEQFFVNGFEGKTIANNTGNFISVGGPALPRIPLQRYLFNNVHSISANLLTSFSKDWELRMNTNYVNDFQTRAGGSTTEIRTLNSDGTPSGIITYLRRSNISLHQEQLNARATLSRNEKNNFIKNVFAFRTDRNTDSGPMFFDDNPVQQRLYAPGVSLQNSFSALVPVNKKKSQNLSLKSFINYIQEKQDYNVQPAAVLQLPDQILKRTLPLQQQLSLRYFEIEKEASLHCATKCSPGFLQFHGLCKIITCNLKRLQKTAVYNALTCQMIGIIMYILQKAQQPLLSVLILIMKYSGFLFLCLYDSILSRPKMKYLILIKTLTGLHLSRVCLCVISFILFGIFPVMQE